MATLGQPTRPTHPEVRRGKIRVLHVIATLDPHGAERQMAALCLRLDRARFEPSVCCLTRGGPLRAGLESVGVSVAVLGKRGRFDIGVLYRLTALIRRIRPDIVHTWLFTANFWGRLAARLARVPRVVASERAADRWKTWAHRWIDRRLAPLADVILANSEGVQSFCVERIGLPARKIVVVRNGIDLPSFDAAASAAPAGIPPARGPAVCAVARMEEQKGHAYLLRAFAEVLRSGREAALWLAGDGPLRRELEALARELGVADRVAFLGRRGDVPALLARCAFVVLPSLWEGLPNAVIEAMAARRAVVATDVDGTPEVAIDGRTALLVPPRDPAALAAAMSRLLDDKALREKLGQAGRERVEAEFTLARMVEQTSRVYRTLLGD